MSKVKIKLVFFGHFPHQISIENVLRWKSELFEIVSPIDSYAIVEDSDLLQWKYSDESIGRQLPTRYDGDVLVAVTSVPIQENYYARRYLHNRVCLSYYEMADILGYANIPLENLVLRVLYSVSFVYKRYGNRVPPTTEETNFAHDETRGCIYDMNGIKSDVVHSLHRPIICPSCVETLSRSRIERNIIAAAQSELLNIQKDMYYRITDFIKGHPIRAIIISSIAAIVLGVISSFVYEAIKSKTLGLGG